MPYFDFAWTPEIEQHLAEHGVTPAEFEEVVMDAGRAERSRSSDNLIVFGETSSNRLLACVYELHTDGITIIPVTAFEP